MPTVAYEIIVSQDGKQSENVAVANATREVVYADTSNSFAYADVFDVNVYSGHLGYGIGLCVAIPVASLQDKARFEREMDTLAKVESYEEVQYEIIQ
jgi:hypothetical protein